MLASDGSNDAVATTNGDSRKKKSRTAFSRRQVLELETTFAACRYVSSVERCRLAARLQLSETQVKVWFQNRRNKWKRQSDMTSSTTTQAAHCLTFTRTNHLPACTTHSVTRTEHSATWNNGSSTMSRQTGAATALISTLADDEDYTDQSPDDAAFDYCHYLSSPVTSVLPIVCPVVSLHSHGN